MSTCPSGAQIEAHVRGDASGGPVGAHLETCERCRGRAERARADLGLLGRLREASVRATDSTAHVPGYRIESELRRGGQGVIYRAVQETTRRAVALKLLAGGRAASARDRKRFEREIELVSRLRHPFVVTVFDSGESRDEPWYAMELVDGRPLDEWVRERDPTMRAKLELFARVCDGVAYAHRRGVIHRDLKPANILVDAEEQPRILDFGAARETATTTAMRVTAPGEFLGTLAYAAPEQLRGDGDEVDTRTDVYALGLVLYELLTGDLPRGRATNVAEIVASSADGAIEPPSRRAPGIDADLDAIVMRALEPDRNARYGSAEALERDVAHHLAGEPVDARERGTWFHLRRQLVRHRKRVALAGVIAVALASAVFAWWREHDRAVHQHEQADVVRSLIQDILGAAAPQRMGSDARVLDVYERVAKEIDGTLKDAPDVQAAVEWTVGDTYRRLLRPQEAEPHLRKALERLRELDDGRQLEVARCANLLSLALSDQNRPESITVAEEALAIRERELGSDDALVAETRRSLAIALLAQFRDRDEARGRALLDRALLDFERLYGAEHPEVAETKFRRALDGNDLAPERVDELLRGALATFERLAPDDPRVIHSATAYASFLQSRGRFDEAHALLDRAVGLTQKLFGDELATDMLRRYARLEFARGNFANAEMLSRQSVAHELRRWAAKRADEAPRLRSLAQRVEQPGAPTAEPPFADAFAELRRLQGDGSFELAQWMNGIAATLRAQNRGTAIEPILREALHIHCRALGSDCPVRQRTIEMLAEELLQERRGGEAVGLLEESLQTFARQGESDSTEAGRANELLVACRDNAAASTTSAR
jgi:serine/threonine protein kinase